VGVAAGPPIVYAADATALLLAPADVANASTTLVADTLIGAVYFVELVVGVIPVVPAVTV
jgi:hypothetical protein